MRKTKKALSIWLKTFVILVCMHEAAGAHFKLVSSGLSPESGLQVIFLGSTSLCVKTEQKQGRAVLSRAERLHFKNDSVH